MANDYKRMWTREEIKGMGGDTQVFQEHLDGKEGKISYREAGDNVEFQFAYDKEATLVEVYQIGSGYQEHGVDKSGIFVSNGIVFNKIQIDSGYVYYKQASGNRIAVRNHYGWLDENYRTIKTSKYTGVWEWLMSNATKISDINEHIKYNQTDNDIFVTSNYLEHTIKAIPTDVSIIEDQGKLELMLEHDGNVLAINDTPNQFLQRRLDKPSAVWDASTSETDLASWLEEKKSSMYVGQIVLYYDDGKGDKYYCIVTNVNTHGSIALKTLGIYLDEGIIKSIDFNNDSERVYYGQYNANDSYSLYNDIMWLKLF